MVLLHQPRYYDPAEPLKSRSKVSGFHCRWSLNHRLLVRKLFTFFLFCIYRANYNNLLYQYWNIITTILYVIDTWSYYNTQIPSMLIIYGLLCYPFIWCWCCCCCCWKVKSSVKLVIKNGYGFHLVDTNIKFHGVFWSAD